MKDKIMTSERLESFIERLGHCCALLWVLCETPGTGATQEDALRGVIDLMENITQDFEADIASAKDYIPAREVVA